MTTYRVYDKDTGPRDFVRYVEAESEQHTKALIDYDPNNWPFMAAAPIPAEMTSECICSEKEQFLFIQVPLDDELEITLWECQNCKRLFESPPDEINWENERMFAAGYEPCGCDHYDISCRCGGAGWYKPSDEDDGDGYIPRYADDDDDGFSLDPYYEEDGCYELDDENEDDGTLAWGPGGHLYHQEASND
jgi:hypothetical protein